jgi:hypothetical protein
MSTKPFVLGFSLLTALWANPAAAQDVPILTATGNPHKAVCADARVIGSCLSGNALIKRLFEGALPHPLGWHLPKTNTIVNTTAAYTFASRWVGDRQYALFVIEAFEPEPDGQRPDCHVCAPLAHLVLMRSQSSGPWMPVATLKNIDSLGTWGQLEILGERESIRISTDRHDNFLIALRTDDMGQGIEVEHQQFFTNQNEQGKPSDTLINLGHIVSRYSECGGSNDQTMGFITQYVVDHSGKGYPQLQVYKTEVNECIDGAPYRTLPRQTHRYSAKHKAYQAVSPARP